MKAWLVVALMVHCFMGATSAAIEEVLPQVDVVAGEDVSAFSDEVLRHAAETEGYGYKYANLDQLKHLVGKFNERRIVEKLLPVEVPQFVGISSSQVVAVLSRAGFDVAACWQEVIASLDAGQRAVAFEDKKIPEVFWTKQSQFVADVHAAFNRLSGENPFNLNETQLTELHKLFTAANQDKLMVRSTGKEDRKDLANAGGNESIPNVEPSMVSVLAAAREVVVSYFGKKSLEQRLGLGDGTVFSGEVFCPVLIQRMIGEQEGGEVPACGVMFTEEPEGGISMREEKDERGRIKTTGISIIQAAYGHNEGVVNSKVVVDTYVVQNIAGKPVFYPIIRNKHERLKPVVGKGLVMVSNSLFSAIVPALSRKALLTLKKFGDALEEHYGYPMDVEFVVRDHTIWIVQARPIVHKADLKNRCPSYIANLQELATTVPHLVMKGRSVVGFGGMITEVAEPAECVVKDRIGVALDEYLYRSVRNKVKAVLSGSDAPATSHEATMFRGEGKPVLYLPEVVPCEAALSQGKKLKISPQQHSAVIIEGESVLVEKDGWCAYPLPREVSVIPLLYADVDPAWRPTPWSGRLDLRASLDLMRDLDGARKEQALEEARQFPNKLFSLINMKTKGLALDRDLKVQITKVLRAAKVLCDRVVALRERDASLLEILLPLNYLEALLYQQLSGEKALGYRSLAQLGKTLGQEQWVSMPGIVNERTRALLVQLNKVNALLLEGKATTAWQALLAQLAQSGDEKAMQMLGRLVADLQSLDLLPFWLHTTMVLDVAEKLGLDAQQASQLIHAWVGNYKKHSPVFNMIRKMRHRVLALNVANFADPKSFATAWQELKAMKELFCGQPFVRNFSHEYSAVVVAAVEVMQKFVDLFDCSIKAMKGSGLWSKEDCAKMFKAMLAEYLDLLKTWVGSMSDEQRASLSAKSSTVSKYLDMLQGLVVGHNFTVADLEPSGSFDASPFAMGTGHDWVTDFNGKRQPQTGEDAYTIIHQSLLNGCARLMPTSVVQKIDLPYGVQEVQAILIRNKAKLVGMQFEDSGIKLMYNIVLGCHSLQIVLQRGKKQQALDMELNFFGGFESERHRWENAAVLACMYHIQQLFEVKINKLGVHALSLAITLRDNKTDHFGQFFTQLLEVVATGAQAELDVAKYPAVSFFDQAECMQCIGLFEQFGSIGHQAGARLFQWGMKYVQAQDESLLEGLTEALFGMTEETPRSDVLQRAGGLGLFEVLVKQGRECDAASRAAAMAVKSDFFVMRQRGFDLLKILVERGQGYDVAINVAADAVKSELLDVQRSGVDLLKILGEREQGCEAIVGIAADAVRRMDRNKQKIGFGLFKMLIDGGYGYDKIAKIAAEAVSGSDPCCIEGGIGILKMLVARGQNYETAVNAAVEAVGMCWDSVQQNGYDLLKGLVEQGQSYSVATSVAVKAMENDNWRMRERGTALFMALIKQGQGYVEAARVAATLMQSLSGKYSGLAIFGALFAKNQGFEVAESAAVKAMYSFNHPGVLQGGLDLFKSLMAQNRSYAEAARVAAKLVAEGFLDGDDDTIYGFDLFKALFGKDRGYEEAASIAVALMNVSTKRARGIKLFAILFEHDKGYDEAIRVAISAVKDDRLSMRRSGFDLFRVLFSKNKGYSEIKQAIADMKANSDGEIRSTGKELEQALEDARSRVE